MNKFLGEYLRLIKISKKYHLVFGVAYAVGLILGVFFSTGAARYVLGENVLNFYVNALSNSGRIYSLVFSVIVSDVFFLLIFYFCSFIFYTVIIDLALVLYRGYVLASVSFLFIKLFGVSGAFVYILCVFIHNVIVSAALSVFAGITAAHCRRKYKKLKNLRNGLIIVSAAAVLIAVILEILILVFILRPIHVTF